MTEKNLLRKACRKRLREFSKENAAFKENSASACRFFLSSAEYKNCALLLCFVSLKDEIDTSFVIEKALAEGKKVAVPRVTSATDMDFFLLNNNLTLKSQLTEGAFGISEPKENLEKISACCLEKKETVVLMPGLAFSMDGYRLGKGRGYYDRYLARTGRKIESPLFGFCFDFQIAQEIAHDEHDVPVGFIVTERGIKKAKTLLFF